MRVWILIGLLAVGAGCASSQNAEAPTKSEKMTETRKAGMGQAGDFLQ